MRKLCLTCGALVLAGCFIVVQDPTGTVAVGVPVPAVAVAARQPQIMAIAAVPGVYYCQSYPNILFYNNTWWRYYGGTWYSAATYGRWILAATIPRIFLRIPPHHVAYRRAVVHHPRFRKPGVIKAPTAVVKPQVRRVPTAKPLPRPPRRIVKPVPRPARPGKPAKPAKPAKPSKKPDKEKEKKKRKPKPMFFNR